MRTSTATGIVSLAAVGALALAGCGGADQRADVATGGSGPGTVLPLPTDPSTTETGSAAAANLARCADVLPVVAVRGLLGGDPEVSGGAPRVTGAVTSTRCDWLAPNGRYLRVITLDGPGLPGRAATVRAGATAVPGRSGIVYHPDRGLIVQVGDRLFQVVAGGAGTAQARVTGLKAIEAIRAAASS